MGIKICIDRGGTFTDCIAFVPGRETIVLKLLSVDPANYSDAPTEGIRRILEIITGRPHPRHKPIDTSNIDLIRMGTTVATNALLERNGERSAFLVTKGFKDLLYIGNQTRPNIFELNIPHPQMLYEEVLEIDERVILVSDSTQEQKYPDKTTKTGITGEKLKILKSPDRDKVWRDLEKIYKKGITSISICLMHSFIFNEHEILIADIARQIGFLNISISSKVMPTVKVVPRGYSATADAYLTPHIQRYIHSFVSGFDVFNQETEKVSKLRIEFMQSDGGLASIDNFSGLRAILSGPAGGVVGYAMTSYDAVEGSPIIGFDMGGTSTDVSRFAGQYEHVFETTTAGIAIQVPQLDINTVASGGGSRLFFRNGLFVVGPESAGANPGPACYRKNGPLTITDANLVLGRLVPDFFPRIFGPSEHEALDLDASKKAFQNMTEEINSITNMQLSLDEVAYGFIKVANEQMCRPIRAITEAKGFDTSKHVLACFGGAGGQHACAIAKILGIKKVLIHRYSSILSAYGLALSDVVKEKQEPCALIYNQANKKVLDETMHRLEQECIEYLINDGFKKDEIGVNRYLNMRFQGTDNAMMILEPEDTDYISQFQKEYRREFGFTLENRDISVDDVRIRAFANSVSLEKTTVHQEFATLVRRPPKSPPVSKVSVYWGEYKSRKDTPVYQLKQLESGEEIPGPALILDSTSTVPVHPNTHALITSEHIVLTTQNESEASLGLELDPIQLAIFSNRFMSIAEQAGRTLQKTAVSTNIKERLDFSCALFGPDGGLVSNAPHIPVHLGSMQEAVKWQLENERFSGKIEEGDCIVTNHPMAGGSHLPDITVITPVFEKDKIIFFVGSRGHHADIGGISAGSMPPESRELYQEGAAIKSFKLVKKGSFDEDGITQLLLKEPAKYPGCTAQVAANQKAISLVKDLIKEYGLEVVQTYMRYIRENAEKAVQNLLRTMAETHGQELEAEDYMDDGSVIRLKISIDKLSGNAKFDFEGSGLEVFGNFNAPRSVTYSAIIYCLRVLVGQEIPLNQGALVPIKVLIPENSFLNPSENAAVVGGNVMTSQRLCDVILKAFKACAASQGCCNNFTFGKDVGQDGKSYGYYETIGGGSGAGPSWNGRSGVQVHMTNTRITDPEILERRYPVILREFGLREGSGGDGQFKGGDGIIREIEFLESVKLSIISERRVFQPYGMYGGENGKSGKNLLLRKSPDGSWRTINFGGKNSAVVYPGDRFRIETPGGGGWGAKM